MQKTKRNTFTAADCLLCTLALLLALGLCVLLGSEPLALRDMADALRSMLTGGEPPIPYIASILSRRIQRSLCAALAGASLSLCGAAMQGLLRNPLADGSTLGVSTGASLGAVAAMAFGITVPGVPYAGTMVTAMAFAFGSLLLILGLAYALDRSFSTHSIILIGMIYSMFASALINLVINFSGEKIKSITFWTMGSLADSMYRDVLILLMALAVCGTVLLFSSRALNAFALGEDNARHVGVNVKAVKLTVLIAVSVLIGVCVSIGGTIGFVGLVMPHIARMLVGPNHRRLLPVSLFSGAIFLLLADLIARTLLGSRQLPIGVVTSLAGAVTFVVIFYRTGKAGNKRC